MNNNILTPIAIVIAGGLIAWGVASNNGSEPNQPDNNGNEEVKIEITENDYIFGSPDAELTIVEYSDIECPYCKNFHFTTKKLMEEYGADGKLALVFRHFPLDQLHQNARQESIAVECAGKLGGAEKFWAYLDAIFTQTMSNDGLDLAQLPVIAETIGLDVEAFNTCLTDESIAKIVNDVQQAGVEMGVRGTPHSFLVDKDGNGTVISGAQPYEAVKAMIESSLEK